MAYEVELPKQFRKSGWKAKIRDKERVEPPHVTVMRGPDAWRIGLRDGEFLVPPGGSWSDIPKGVRSALEKACQELKGKWDETYPENPIGGENE